MIRNILFCFVLFAFLARNGESLMFQSASLVDAEEAIDECALQQDDCDKDADCYDTVALYICVCKEGYFGDGKHCEKVESTTKEKKKMDENKESKDEKHLQRERKKQERLNRIEKKKQKREKRIKRAHRLRQKRKRKRALRHRRRSKVRQNSRDSKLSPLLPDLSRPVVTLLFPVPVDILFDAVFGKDSNLYEKWVRKIHAYDITIGEWRPGADEYEGNSVRDLDYKVELQEINLFIPEGYIGLKTKQVHFGSSEEGSRYVVDNHNYMEGIPFSETFHSVARHSFTAVSPNESELKVTSELRFTQKPWSFLKKQLEDNVYTEFDLNYKILGDILHSTLEEGAS